jgi:hypothetical protein
MSSEQPNPPLGSLFHTSEVRREIRLLVRWCRKPPLGSYPSTLQVTRRDSISAVVRCSRNCPSLSRLATCIRTEWHPRIHNATVLLHHAYWLLAAQAAKSTVLTLVGLVYPLPNSCPIIWNCIRTPENGFQFIWAIGLEQLSTTIICMRHPDRRNALRFGDTCFSASRMDSRSRQEASQGQ